MKIYLRLICKKYNKIYVNNFKINLLKELE